MEHEKEEARSELDEAHEEAGLAGEGCAKAIKAFTPNFMMS